MQPVESIDDYCQVLCVAHNPQSPSSSSLLLFAASHMHCQLDGISNKVPTKCIWTFRTPSPQCSLQLSTWQLILLCPLPDATITSCTHSRGSAAAVPEEIETHMCIVIIIVIISICVCLARTCACTSQVSPFAHSRASTWVVHCTGQSYFVKKENSNVCPRSGGGKCGLEMYRYVRQSNNIFLLPG